MCWRDLRANPVHVDQIVDSIGQLFPHMHYMVYQSRLGGDHTTTLFLDGRPNWMPQAWQQLYNALHPNNQIFIETIANIRYGVLALTAVHPPPLSSYRVCAICDNFIVTDENELDEHKESCV
jgi:hypothetical protein